MRQPTDPAIRNFPTPQTDLKAHAVCALWQIIADDDRMPLRPMILKGSSFVDLLNPPTIRFPERPAA